MITEDYVSFETAKLLKEKRFDGFCNRYYQTDKEDVNGEYAMFMFASDLKSFCTVTNRLLNKYVDKNHEIISAPTIQMAMKWLREEKHIFIEVLVDTMIKGAFTWRLFEYPSLEIMPYDGWENTYEEACEYAIKYCLENLI